MPRQVTVADCERVQAAWFKTRVAVLGGQVHEVDGSRWLDGVDGVNLMFPTRLTPRAAAAGIEVARARRVLAGVWLGLDIDPTPLAAAGFERGWSPWWMTAPLADVGPPFDDRVVLRETSDAAAGAGATHAVLNATPEGKALYDTCGFRHVGAGITWWWHPPAPDTGQASPTLMP